MGEQHLKVAAFWLSECLDIINLGMVLADYMQPYFWLGRASIRPKSYRLLLLRSTVQQRCHAHRSFTSRLPHFAYFCIQRRFTVSAPVEKLLTDPDAKIL